MRRLLAAVRSLLRSLRARLVGSYLLLTLITVTLMSVMTLTLIRSYTEHRERHYLMTQARALVPQAVELMTPEPQLETLNDLALSVAATANVRG